MTQTQKVIKYCALILALIIIISIASAAISLFSIALSFVDDGDENIEYLSELEINDTQSIHSLVISTRSASLKIKIGDSFKAETNSSHIKCSSDKGILTITERSYAKILSENSEVILYIPSDFEFSSVKISSGAGVINIASLSTEKISFELGAGKVTIEEITVKNEADIDGGAGELEIKSGHINDLDLDAGVGKIDMTLSLTGENEINMGVGKLNLTLLGEKESYYIDVDKGLGSVDIDGKNMYNGETYGNGNKKIEIDGGIGAININFK